MSKPRDLVLFYRWWSGGTVVEFPFERFDNVPQRGLAAALEQYAQEWIDAEHGGEDGWQAARAEALRQEDRVRRAKASGSPEAGGWPRPPSARRNESVLSESTDFWAMIKADKRPLLQQYLLETCAIHEDRRGGFHVRQREVPTPLEEVVSSPRYVLRCADKEAARLVAGHLSAHDGRMLALPAGRIGTKVWFYPQHLRFGAVAIDDLAPEERLEALVDLEAPDLGPLRGRAERILMLAHGDPVEPQSSSRDEGGTIALATSDGEAPRTPPPDGERRPDLPERARSALQALMEEKAVDAKSRIKARVVAEKAFGDPKEHLVADVLAELGRLGLVSSKRGQGGGYHLTDSGLRVAQGKGDLKPGQS